MVGVIILYTSTIAISTASSPCIETNTANNQHLFSLRAYIHGIQPTYIWHRFSCDVASVIKRCTYTYI